CRAPCAQARLAHLTPASRVVCMPRPALAVVMAGLGPAIHDFPCHSREMGSELLSTCLILLFSPVGKTVRRVGKFLFALWPGLPCGLARRPSRIFRPPQATYGPRLP